MKNPFIDLYGCMCLTLLTLAPQPAAAKTAGEVPPADTLRTVFFTDIHVTPGNVQDSLFRIAVAEANASDADLVIFGGDLTNMGSDREQAHVHGLMSQLRKPWFTVPGNHETTWSESGCTTFRRLFGHAGCVASRAKGYLFLGYASGPYMKMADGMIRGEDLAWLERQAAAARPGERIVSLCHYPLNGDLTNRQEVTETLKSVGVTASLYGHYHQLQLRNFGPRARGQKGRSAGVYAARLFRRLGAHTREAARHAPGHPVYGLPERRSADIGAPLRPAAAGARRRRPHAAGRAGQRHGADGSGILRRGALLRQFAGRTARLRHAQGTRIVAARLSGRALHPPALHRRTRDRGSRIGRHMGLRRPDGAREMAPSDAERRRGRRNYGRRGIIYRSGNRFHRQDRPAQRQAVVAARLRLRAGAGVRRWPTDGSYSAHGTAISIVSMQAPANCSGSGTTAAAVSSSRRGTSYPASPAARSSSSPRTAS